MTSVRQIQVQREEPTEMALYFLTHDLRSGRNYQKLYDELEKFNAVRILESLWCFHRYNTSAKGLRNYFKQFIELMTN